MVVQIFIVFNSDRIGNPSIYIMKLDGASVKKISFGDGSYYNPSFSPDTNIILFTKIYEKNFSIGLMNLSGMEKIIANDHLAESPKWLNTGRHIAYQYKYNSKDYALYIMDLVSGHKIQIKPSVNSMDPSFIQNNSIIKKNSVKSRL